MQKLLRLEVKVLMKLMKQVCTLNQVLRWKADKMFTLSIADNTQHSKHRWSSSTTLRLPKNIFQWIQKWKVCFQRTCGQPTRGDKKQWMYKQYEQKTWSPPLLTFEKKGKMSGLKLLRVGWNMLKICYWCSVPAVIQCEFYCTYQMNQRQNN